jgi:hypothetical protein
MMLLKCLLAGVLSVVLIAILLVVVLLVFVLPRPDKGTVVGIDPVTIIRSRPLLALMITSLCFAIGFLWEYIRTR